MSAVVEAVGLTKRFGGGVTAVDDVSFSVEEGRVTGLLGRNGAGKTTLLGMITGQEFPTAGVVRVFGAAPAENAAVQRRTCFVKESQRYPDDFQVQHVLATAPLFLPGWDAAFAADLVDAFRLPVKRRVKKLSRGQRSAVGIVVGLASRADLTLFDEPYLGLDAVARQLFYDRLLADYAAHPRTVVLSTHLIDEVGDLLERVLVIDEGRIVVDRATDELRGTAVTVTGPRAAVDAFAEGRVVLKRQVLGGTAAVTVTGIGERERADAVRLGLEVESLSLQQIVVSTTTARPGREVHA